MLNCQLRPRLTSPQAHSIDRNARARGLQLGSAGGTRSRGGDLHLLDRQTGGQLCCQAHLQPIAHFWFETHTRSESVSIVHSCGNPSSPVGSSIVLNDQLRHRTLRTDLLLPGCSYPKHAMRVFHQLCLVGRPAAHLTKTGPADPSSYSGCFITFLIWALIPVDQLGTEAMRAIGLTIKIFIVDSSHLEYVFNVGIQKQDRESTDFCSIVQYSPVTRGR